MTEFVRGILVDVGRHIIVNDFQRSGVRTVRIDEVRVLLPKIGFQNFRCGKKSQNGCIRIRDGTQPCSSAVLIRQCGAKWHERSTSEGETFHEKSTAYSRAEPVMITFVD